MISIDNFAIAKNPHFKNNADQFFDHIYNLFFIVYLSSPIGILFYVSKFTTKYLEITYGQNNGKLNVYYYSDYHLEKVFNLPMVIPEEKCFLFFL